MMVSIIGPFQLLENVLAIIMSAKFGYILVNAQLLWLIFLPEKSVKFDHWMFSTTPIKFVKAPYCSQYSRLIFGGTFLVRWGVRKVNTINENFLNELGKLNRTLSVNSKYMWISNYIFIVRYIQIFTAFNREFYSTNMNRNKITYSKSLNFPNFHYLNFEVC